VTRQRPWAVILQAFLKPVRHAADIEVRDSLKVLTRVQFEYKIAPEVVDSLKTPVRRFRDLIARSLPTVAADDLDWRMELALAVAFYSLFFQQDSESIDATIARLIAFVSAGVQAVLQPQITTRQCRTRR
jgi:hypothetical protein